VKYSDNPRLRFAVTSDAAVQITVYDATGSKIDVDDGAIVLRLIRGLYRVHLERCGVVRERLVELDQETMLHDPGPPLHTPAPLVGAATSHDYYSEPARKVSVSDTCRPLGNGPHRSRLFIFVRRKDKQIGPPRVPSEPVTIHDLTGRKLVTLHRDTAQVDDEFGYLAFSCRVAHGTYRIRAVHSRRELAITIPENRAAHVFIADVGAVRIEDLRVTLTDLDCPFDPESRVAQAMESVLAALRSPKRVFPPDARVLLPEAVDQDLCFGIAAAHQLWRCGNRAMFDQVVQRLMQYASVPDIAILEQLQQLARLTVQLRLEAPPLMQASFVMAMTRPEFDSSKIAPDSAIARVAGTALHDSTWCTWSTRAWDKRWIEPTVESLRALGHGNDVVSIAWTIGLPPRTVERTLNDLDSRLPLMNGSPMRLEDVRIPGYVIGEVLGRGERGTVFRATRATDNRAVALKIIPLAEGREQRERIERTLDRMQRLDHAGLLMYEHRGVLPNDAGMWFDMEVCRGSVLDLLPDSDAPLPFDRTCEIVLQALEVLEYLHSEGVIHGNIKPSNLLFRANGSIAVADFGLTEGFLHNGQFISSGRAAGTVRFMPHERLIDVKQVAAASDVWSMAATLYFLLTADLPRDEYADQNELEVALKNPLVPIAERWVEIPAALARCIDRALSNDIRVRPKDGAEFRNDMMTTLGLYPIKRPRGESFNQQKASRSQRKAYRDISSISSIRNRVASHSLRSGLVETWQTERQEDSFVGLTSRDHAIAHLRILTGPSVHEAHVFQARGTSIGRVGGDCDVSFDDGRMSRRHAQIERGITGWRLQDLVSRNGGFVDGRSFGPGERMPLVDGAVIRLGDTLMVFRTSAPTSDGRTDSPVFPGISPPVVALRRRIDALAAGTGHVLIVGETGTGKERVAKAIGESRAPNPFVTLNSAGLSRDLARSELFGHVRGAFTKATGNKLGLEDLAGDGVLFLDEIGELSLDVQADLLHFLEDGSYRPLGSTELRHSNARVIAATHVDLDQAAANNKFRRDLLARLRASNVPLELPPLRERREDILGWTQLFLRQGNHDAGPSPWTVGALECLLLYPWPENLRGLRSVVLEVAQSQSFPCSTEHLPRALRSYRGTLRALANAPPDESTPAQVAAQVEPSKAEIEEALRSTRGRMRTAAMQLGIDRRKLYRLCDRFGITLEAFRGDNQQEDE
jgi:DNA-binding NtrC family response regulator/serine/threonine protein kinase